MQRPEIRAVFQQDLLEAYRQGGAAVAHEMQLLARPWQIDLDAGFLAGTCDVDASFLDYVRPLVGVMPTAGRLSDFAIG